MTKPAAVIATIKSFNIARANELKTSFSDTWDITVITDKVQLTAENMSEINPRYIFFPHWSWMIPADVYDRFECVIFHMTDLPFGRGGSPLQNLIARGIYKTKISALKASKGADTGPVYFKRDFDISHGNADEILNQASAIVFDSMIPKFLTAAATPVAQAQEGEPVCFARRKPQDSELTALPPKNVRELYDFIRMLDGEGYPPAFFTAGRLKIELRGVKTENGRLTGTFEVKENETE